MEAAELAIRTLGTLAEGVRRLTSSRQAVRWQAVTVLAPADAVGADGTWPAPLAELGDKIEIRTNPAPADKGTELRARVRTGDPELQQQLRAALRRSKQLIETGGVLSLDPHPAGRRTETVRGKVIDLADAVAGREGML